ncbi:MAG: hypothetical protein WCV91_03110 [Candidatus Margulisiibacteriota bacterium]
MFKLAYLLIIFLATGCFGLSTAVFNTDYISDLIPFQERNTVFYLKDGNVWQKSQETPPTKILDLDDDICAFDISSDQKSIVCSIKKGPEQPSSSPLYQKIGDTIQLYSVSDGQGYEIYSDGHAQIKNILFTQGSGLFVIALSNKKENIVLILDPTTKLYKTFSKDRRSDMNSTLFIQDVSPDGKYALLRYAFFEGSMQRILNLASLTLEGYQTSSTVVQGNYLLGFIGSDQLLGYKGAMIGPNNFKITLSARNFINKEESTVLDYNFDMVPTYFDGKSDPNKVYFRLSPHTGDNKSVFYEIDKNTYKCRVLSSKRNILAYIGTNQSLWITNTSLNNPQFVDLGIKSSQDIKVK